MKKWSYRILFTILTSLPFALVIAITYLFNLNTLMSFFDMATPQGFLIFLGLFLLPVWLIKYDDITKKEI